MPGGRVLDKIRKAAAVTAVAFLALLNLSGCSGEALGDFLETASDLYQQMRPSVSMAGDDKYYEYRHDFHHANWSGEAYLDLGSAGFSFSDVVGAGAYADPEFKTDTHGRPSSVTAYIQGPVQNDRSDLAGYIPNDRSDPSGSIPDPPGWQVARYPGAAQDGLLYRRCMLLPESLGGDYSKRNLFTGTSYLYYGAYADAVSDINTWLESHPDGPGLLYYAALLYEGGHSVPDGILIKAYSSDGSLELCRYVFNLQPGIGIDYSDGRSWVEKAGDPEASNSPDGSGSSGDAD